MTQFVLDASAMLALIQGERGSERVAQSLEQGQCVVSVINLSETMAKLVMNGVPAEPAEAVVRGIPAQAVPCDEVIAYKAGALAAIGRPLGLSLGDRICLATAQSLGGIILTTEQAWRKVHLEGVQIEVIRESSTAKAE